MLFSSFSSITATTSNINVEVNMFMTPC